MNKEEAFEIAVDAERAAVDTRCARLLAELQLQEAEAQSEHSEKGTSALLDRVANARAALGLTDRAERAASEYAEHAWEAFERTVGERETQQETYDRRTQGRTITIQPTQGRTITIRREPVPEIRRRSRGTALIRPPLFRLDRIAKFFFSKKTYDRVFAPLKADLVHEWMEAEVAGRRRHAWFMKWVRGPFAQLSHMAMQLPFSIAKHIADAVRARLE